MSQPDRRLDSAFGYITAVESPDHGFFGGYLIVSLLGRPLEFHCTAPVRPSRAQQILYGPTLGPYLLGEQIGGTLVKAAKITPDIVLTDREALLHARELLGVPMALVLSADELRQLCSNSQIAIGACKLQLPFGYEQDEPLVTNLLAHLTQRVDLAEPFGRIREAILEAQRIGGSGGETHEQAA